MPTPPSQRPIKFRVWYKAESRYLETPDGLFFKYPSSNGGEYIGDFIKDTDVYVTEQYTGLLDKEGREVYEGDIIEYFDWCYASRSRPNGRDPINWWFESWDKEYSHTDAYYPEAGVVAWDPVACTWAPTISSTDVYNESSFAYVCRIDPAHLGIPQLNSRGLPNYPDPYYRVIGNVNQNPDLIPPCV